jgi:hypothetical protein
MKSKIFIMGVFFAILMFFTLNMAWAHDPTSKDREYKSHRYNGGHQGGHLNYGFIQLTKEQKRFERAKRRAWADGRLTYKEMRRLHQFERKAIKSLQRLERHRGPYQHKNRKHISYGHKRYVFPKFSVMFSFSEPNSHIAGSFGVR